MKTLANAIVITTALLCFSGLCTPASGVVYNISLIPELPDWPTGVNDYGEWAEVVMPPDPDDPVGGWPHALLHHQDGSEEHLWDLWGDDLWTEDINNSQHIVGTCDYDHTHDEGQAFIWERGVGMTWLGSLAGTNWHFSVAYDINNLDQVVGESWTADEHDVAAFYWDASSGLQNLNDLISEDSGWYLYDALNINDAGQIVGRGSGGYYLLTPAPIPPSILLMGSSILFICRRRGWKRP